MGCTAAAAGRRRVRIGALLSTQQSALTCVRMPAAAPPRAPHPFGQPDPRRGSVALCAAAVGSSQLQSSLARTVGLASQRSPTPRSGVQQGVS